MYPAATSSLMSVTPKIASYEKPTSTLEFAISSMELPAPVINHVSIATKFFGQGLQVKFCLFDT